MRPFFPILVFYSLLLAIVFGLHPVETYDTWWHLASGRWILEHGQVPQVDVFSYTALGKPWINHEWGAGLFFWLVFSKFGVVGLNLLPVFVFWLTLYFAGRTLQTITTNETPFLGLFILAWLCSLRIVPRPHIFSLLFLSILFFIFSRSIRLKTGGQISHEPQATQYPYLLPPLFLLWANLHGEVFIGIILFLLFVIGNGLERYRASQMSRPIGPPLQKKWMFVFLISAFAVLINPYFEKIYTFPFEHFALKTIMSSTQEMISPFMSERRFYLVYQGYFLLLGLTALGVVLKWRQIPLPMLFMGLPLVYLSMTSNRFIALFSMWAIFVGRSNPPLNTAHKSGTHLAYRRYRMSSLIRTFLPLIFCGIFLFLKGVPNTLMGGLRPIGFGVIPQTAPLETVDFLKKQGLRDGIFNDMELGAYLILEGFPVFIDGRTPVYGDDFYSRYIITHFVPQVFEELNQQWKFKALVLARAFEKESQPLHGYLQSSGEWNLAHQDDTAFVYLFKTP